MSTRRRRQMVGLGDLAESFMRRVDKDGGGPKARAVLAWREVIGPEIDQHTTGFALNGSELVVFVDSGAWATELAAMAEEMRLRLNEVIGQDLVGSIRFTVSRHVRRRRDEEAIAEQARKDSGAEDIEPVPLTDIEQRQIEYMTSSIDDEGLRDIAARVMTLDQELKKGRRAKAPDRQ